MSSSDIDVQRSRVYFLVKDPHWTFLWWSVSREAAWQSASRLGYVGWRMVLRIYDVTHILFDGKNALSWFDIEVTSNAGHWYLNVLGCNRNYLADIGLRGSDGQFVACARSHSVYLPRDHASGTAASHVTTIAF